MGNGKQDVADLAQSGQEAAAEVANTTTLISI
jgi:hypothetical protein